MRDHYKKRTTCLIGQSRLSRWSNRSRYWVDCLRHLLALLSCIVSRNWLSSRQIGHPYFYLTKSRLTYIQWRINLRIFYWLWGLALTEAYEPQVALYLFDWTRGSRRRRNLRVTELATWRRSESRIIELNRWKPSWVPAAASHAISHPIKLNGSPEPWVDKGWRRRSCSGYGKKLELEVVTPSWWAHGLRIVHVRLRAWLTSD